MVPSAIERMIENHRKGLELNVWVFLPFWDRFLQENNASDIHISFLLNEGFRELLGFGNGQYTFPGITPEHCVFLTDDDFSALHGGAMTQGRLREVQDALTSQGICPDTLVHRIPSPWAGQLFPDATAMYMEVGPFNRPPYPSTHFFDPLGYGSDSVVARCADEILQLAQELDDIVSPLAERMSPLFVREESHAAAYVAALRERYAHVVLFAAQYPSFFYTPYTRFRDMADLLEDVLSHTPDDTALVFCPRAHNRPEHGIASERMAELSDRFTCLEQVPEDLMKPYYTQMLVPFADGVFAVTSTVGLQALLWNKHWFTTPECYYRAFTPDYREIGEIIGKASDPRGRLMMNWILQRYALPTALLKKEDWLANYFRTCHAETKVDQKNNKMLFCTAGYHDADKLIEYYAHDIAHIMNRK